ncbi:MAG: hypothetical protein IJL45_02985 [Prevotella sp.]|nr:hypothetical protein [Prevotella sp.]
MAKLTTEEFIKRAREVHGDRYDYSKVEYVNSKEKVTIICPEHGEFPQTPQKHLYGQGCPKCGNKPKITTEEFIKKAQAMHGNKYDYSKVEYVDAQTDVCIICKQHGEFWQRPSHHTAGRGCKKCATEVNAGKLRYWTETKCYEEAFRYKDMKSFRTQSEDAYNAALKHHWLKNYTWLSYKIDVSNPKKKRQSYTQEEIIKKLRSIFSDRYSYEKVEYKAMKVPITLVCHERDADGVEHGEFSMRPDNIFSSNQACPKCCDARRSKLQRKPVEKFIEEATKVHGGLYEYHKVEYVNGKTKVCIVCPIHGEFWQSPTNHLKGKGCPYCSGNAKRWNKETCEQEARKHEYIFTFSTRASAAYSKALSNGWLKDYTWLKRLPPNTADYEKEKKYIYAYEFVEKKAVYVGLTNSMIKRDWQHRNSKDSSVFRFAEESGCTIPVPRQLEEGIPIHESGKREAFWVEHYKRLNWKLLNRAKTGERESSIGGSYPLKWTKKTIREKAKECDYDIKLFQELYIGAYEAILSRYRGLLNELFPHRAKHTHHTIEDALLVVNKGHFKNRMHLHRECSWAYRILYNNRMLDDVFGKPREYTKNEALKEAANYRSIEQIRVKNHHLYSYLKKNNLFKEAKPTDAMFRRAKTIEGAWEVSQYYNSITELCNHASVAYRLLKEAGLLQKRYPNSVRKAVLQYSLDGTFVKEWPNAYSAGRALKISGIGEVCKRNQKTAGGFLWKYKEVNNE